MHFLPQKKKKKGLSLNLCMMITSVDFTSCYTHSYQFQLPTTITHFQGQNYVTGEFFKSSKKKENIDSYVFHLNVSQVNGSS